jgi:hypothetical protein
MSQFRGKGLLPYRSRWTALFSVVSRSLGHAKGTKLDRCKVLRSRPDVPVVACPATAGLCSVTPAEVRVTVVMTPIVDTRVRHDPLNRAEAGRIRVSSHPDRRCLARCSRNSSLGAPSGSNDRRRRSTCSGRRAAHRCHPLGPFRLAAHRRTSR